MHIQQKNTNRVKGTNKHQRCLSSLTVRVLVLFVVQMMNQLVQTVDKGKPLSAFLWPGTKLPTADICEFPGYFFIKTFLDPADLDKLWGIPFLVSRAFECVASASQTHEKEGTSLALVFHYSAFEYGRSASHFE